MQRARAFHALTAVVAIFAVVFQLVLVFQGGRVLDETAAEPDSASGSSSSSPTSRSRATSWSRSRPSSWPATRPATGPACGLLRLAAMLGITVTGIVHFSLLRPLLDLDGADYVADKLLHMVVPVLAVVGWALFGPRPRVDGAALGPAARWPIAWLAGRLVVGALSGWYPYPFLDPARRTGERWSWPAIGITVLLLRCSGRGAIASRTAVPR